jgi:hypothetical protein
MNDLNSYSILRFEIGPEECETWKPFSDVIRKSQSWSSDWFATARRFFLSGGAKEFNAKWDDVDRILDYATALESTLVPEKKKLPPAEEDRRVTLAGLYDPTDEDRGSFVFEKFRDQDAGSSESDCSQDRTIGGRVNSA